MQLLFLRGGIKEKDTYVKVTGYGVLNPYPTGIICPDAVKVDLCDVESLSNHVTVV